VLRISTLAQWSLRRVALFLTVGFTVATVVSARLLLSTT
jgi:hypothetical protein